MIDVLVHFSLKFSPKHEQGSKTPGPRFSSSKDLLSFLMDVAAAAGLCLLLSPGAGPLPGLRSLDLKAAGPRLTSSRIRNRGICEGAWPLVKEEEPEELKV